MKTLPILFLLLLLLFHPSAHAHNETVEDQDQEDEGEGEQRPDVEDYSGHAYDENSSNPSNPKCKKYNNLMYDYGHQDPCGFERPGGIKFTDPCKSATVNTHGCYTAHLKACTIQFHQIEDETVSSSLLLSSACSESNAVKENNKNLELVDYVIKWPDECVGDFQRCYDISRDEATFLRHFCKDPQKFDLLKRATHVSVDCTADKAAEQQKIKKQEQDGVEYDSDYGQYTSPSHQRKRQMEFYAFIIGIIVICLASGFCFMYCTYTYGFRPYLATIKSRKSDPELVALGGAVDNESGVSTRSERLRSRA